jgi:hypothetical protein
MTTRQPCRIGALAEWLAKHAGGGTASTITTAFNSSIPTGDRFDFTAEQVIDYCEASDS